MGKRDLKNGRAKDRGARRPGGELNRALDALGAVLGDPALPQALAQARATQGRRKSAALNEGALDRLIEAGAALERLRSTDRPRRRTNGKADSAGVATPLARLAALAERVRASDGSRAGVKALMRELSDRDSGYNAADVATVAFEVTGARRRTKREALTAIEAWLKQRGKPASSARRGAAKAAV